MFATWDLAAEQINENLAKGETSIDIKRRVAHPMLAAKLSHRHTAFSLSQDRDDLRLNGIRPVEARCQEFSACQIHGMSSSMRLIL